MNSSSTALTSNPHECGYDQQMDRIPTWGFAIGALVFAGLALWSALDENWAGLLVGLILLAVCIVVVVRRERPSAS
jgi:hypothetical protein